MVVKNIMLDYRGDKWLDGWTGLRDTVNYLKFKKPDRQKKEMSWE